MQQSTTGKARDTLNTQNNVKETHNKKSTSLTERKKIEGTPFTMIKTPMDDVEGIYNDEYFIVMGDHRITEPTNTEKEQLDKLVKDYWLIVLNVIAIVVEKYKYIEGVANLQTAQQNSDSLTKKYETESL